MMYIYIYFHCISVQLKILYVLHNIRMHQVCLVFAMFLVRGLAIKVRVTAASA